MGSTGGTFYALNELTGATLWSVTLAGPVTAAANIASAYVSVGDGAGHVSSLSVSDGTLKGALSIGHPVTGLVSTLGINIASTANGRLVLRRAPTGAVETWIYGGATSSYVAPGVILNGEFLVAAGNGQLQAFAIPGRSLY